MDKEDWELFKQDYDSTSFSGFWGMFPKEVSSDFCKKLGVASQMSQLQEFKKGIADSIIPGQSAWKSLTRSDLEMLFEV